MNRFSHFSQHAQLRLDQRSTLTCHECAKLLDCQVFVKVGEEPGFNREHRLFYSVQDGSYYVAIQDIHTGSIVTILPPEYYRNLCWSIKDHQFIAAKEAALNPPQRYESYEEVEKTRSAVFIVTAFFLDSERRQKAKQAIKVDATPYNRDFEALISCPQFRRSLRNSFAGRGIEASTVWSISVRLGKRGEAVYFDWRDNTPVKENYEH
ncbi:hypothetical protein [Dongshaea marina]|uniref:hypothetical protein n=1 Tax=Dongshaea marina TaxID=2047966 RepID=UPI000D3E8392|nr:hypothetical protein [Dongshaea marina]